MYLPTYIPCTLQYCIVSNSSILAHCAIYILPRLTSLPACRWPRLSLITPSFPVTYNIIIIHIHIGYMYLHDVSSCVLPSLTLSLGPTNCNQSNSRSKNSYPTTASSYLNLTYHNVLLVLHIPKRTLFLFPTWARMANWSRVFCCSGNYLHPTKSYMNLPKKLNEEPILTILLHVSSSYLQLPLRQTTPRHFAPTFYFSLHAARFSLCCSYPSNQAHCVKPTPQPKSNVPGKYL